MNFKKCLLFVLSLIVLCITLSACKEDEESDDPDDEDYTGSITPDSGDTEPDTPDDEPFDEGDENATVYISDADDLKDIKPKGTYILESDIDLKGAEWTPIGTAAHPFSGTLKSADEKNPCTISNFKIPDSKISISDGDISPYYNYAYGGFFGVTSDATIENVVFENVTVDISMNNESLCVYAGVVAGYAKNTLFSGVTVNASTVTAKSEEHKTCVGGLVGSMHLSSKAENCSVNADCTAGESANNAICGGISGELIESDLIWCVSSGSAKAFAKYGLSYSGGLIGYCSSGKISKCVSGSDVTSEVTSSFPQEGMCGAAYAGGAVAIVTAPTGGTKRVVITESYAEGTVTAKSNDNAVHSGGFVAKSEYGIYEDCYSRSIVYAESENQAIYAAGFIADFIYTSYSENSEANGSGYSYDTNIKGCLALGKLNIKTGTKAFFFGKLVYSDSEKENDKIPFVDKSGYSVTVTVTDFNNNDVSYDKDSKIYDNYLGGAIGLSIDSLKNNQGWNAESWEMKDGYPTLKKNNSASESENG